VLLAFALVGGAVTGCAQDRSPVIETVEPTEETTSSLTPLERGKLRREVLDEVRAFIESWKASDADAVEAALPEAFAKKFTDVWDEYAQDGLKVRHVHDVTVLDVTEFNRAATQASVSYAYVDNSYLVDADGDKVLGLPPVDASLTITLEREEGSDEWKIVRMFVKEEGFR
jgi:type IV pilus biogenesis protein CpaD/CtpE